MICYIRRMETKTRLCIGGPLNGQYATLEGGKEFMTPRPVYLREPCFLGVGAEAARSAIVETVTYVARELAFPDGDVVALFVPVDQSAEETARLLGRD